MNCVGSCGRRCVNAAENLAAERLTAVEIPAGLGTLVVDRAQPGDWVQGDAGAIAALIHAALALVLDDEPSGHVIIFAE